MDLKRMLKKCQREDWDKQTKAMNVKLSDLRKEQAKELNKAFHKYKVYPTTRPACDFN